MMMEAITNVLEATANWLIACAMLMWAITELACKHLFRPTQEQARHNGDIHMQALAAAGNVMAQAATLAATDVAEAEIELGVAPVEDDPDEPVTLKIGDEQYMVTRRDLRAYDDWKKTFTFYEYLHLVVASQDYYARLHLTHPETQQSGGGGPTA